MYEDLIGPFLRYGFMQRALFDANRHGDEIEAISLSHDAPFSAGRRYLPASRDDQCRLWSSAPEGLFALTDDPARPLVAHAVQQRLYPLKRLDHWPDEDHRSRVVLIGQDMPAKPIRDLFEVLAPRTARARRGVA